MYIVRGPEDGMPSACSFREEQKSLKQGVDLLQICPIMCGSLERKASGRILRNPRNTIFDSVRRKFVRASVERSEVQSCRCLLTALSQFSSRWVQQCTDVIRKR
jgi:hypothetical protein